MSVCNNGSEYIPGDLKVGGYITAAGGFRLQTDAASEATADLTVMQKSSITLTDAQIKSLPTNPIQIVSAPGSGKYISVISGSITVNRSVNYTNIDPLAWVAIAINPAGNGPDVLAPFTERNQGSYGSVTDLLTGNPDILSNWCPMANFTAQGATAPFTVGPNVPFLKSWILNQGLFVYATNGASGDFTGGDSANSMKLNVIYCIMDE